MSGTSGCSTSRVADGRAAAVDDVQDARRAGRPPRRSRRSARRAAACRVAGLKTTVLPQTSAGAIFQLGIAIGKFHGVIAPTTPTGIADAHLELVRHLRRRRLAEDAAALAGHVVRHVDRFLDVAAGLGAHLAHLPDHELGQLVLAVDEPLRDAEEDLGALRRRHEPPALVGRLRGLDGAVDVLDGRLRERPDRLAGRRVRALEGLAARRPRPTRRRCSSGTSSSPSSPSRPLRSPARRFYAGDSARLARRLGRPSPGTSPGCGRGGGRGPGACRRASRPARRAPVGPRAPVDDDRHVRVVLVVLDEPVVELVLELRGNDAVDHSLRILGGRAPAT